MQYKNSKFDSRGYGVQRFIKKRRFRNGFSSRRQGNGVRSQQYTYNKKFYAHYAPADHLILAGVARAHLIAMCRKLNIDVEIRPFYLDEMKSADEIIVTSAGSLCLQVESIDGEKAGGKAQDLYR